MSRRVGGREATTGVIPGEVCLSVGKPSQPAPDGWKWVSLLDVARLESGHTPSRRKPEYWGGEVPWIGIKDATGNHGRTIYDTIQHTNDLGIQNSAARILPRNTVCLSRTASVGYVVVMGKPMATSQDFANWVCGPRLDYRFLKYAFLADNKSLNRFSHGSTHQTIYYPELKAFHVCMPEIAEQRCIADTLQALDDKIDLNRRMAATLEEMARALYRSWFVDFDPVKAKAEGLAPTYMDDATAALFPDRFGDDGLPEGWQATTIGEVAEIVGGGTPSTKNPEYWDNGTYAWATPKDLAGLSDAFLIETSRKITDHGLAKIGSGLSPARSMLLSSRAPIGYRAIARMPVAVNQGFIVIRETATITGVEAYLWCEMNMDSILSNANGSTFQEISKKNFRPIPYILADEPVRRAFGNLATPMFAKLATLSEESRTLAALRDTLLPELMSGRLRVGEVRNQIEEAA